MNEKDIRRHLERWDPAADHQPPPELRQRTRARLAERRATGHGPPWAPRWSLAALAGLAAVLIAVLALRLSEPGPATTVTQPVTDSVHAEPPIQVIYTASNGVRIYWSVPAESASRN